MLLSCLPFLLKTKGYTLLTNNSNLLVQNNTQIALTPLNYKKLNLYLKYSFLAFNSWLLDLGCYETTFFLKQKQFYNSQILWALYKLNSNTLLTLTVSPKNKSSSIELLFRNSKWLERETSEMSGWFFLNKRDRRVLFLIPVFFSTPLKKSFPTGGFFELLMCPFTSKLTYKHVSWLS